MVQWDTKRNETRTTGSSSSLRLLPGVFRALTVRYSDRLSLAFSWALVCLSSLGVVVFSLLSGVSGWTAGEVLSLLGLGIAFFKLYATSLQLAKRESSSEINTLTPLETVRTSSQKRTRRRSD